MARMMNGETQDNRVLVHGHRVPTWTLSHVGNDATPRWDYGHFQLHPSRPDKIGRNARWSVHRVVDGRIEACRGLDMTLDGAKAHVEVDWLSWAERTPAQDGQR
jgi:hypothetical protein